MGSPNLDHGVRRADLILFSEVGIGEPRRRGMKMMRSDLPPLPRLVRVPFEMAPERANFEEHAVGSLSTPIAAIAAELAGEGVISAPVQLPDQTQLTVQLVPLSTLQKLDEARDEANIPMTFFVTLFGIEFGLLPSVLQALGRPFTTPDIFVMCLAGLLIPTMVLPAILWRRATKKIEAVRKTIYGHAPVPQ